MPGKEASLMAQCSSAGGSLPAGILLSRVLYWERKQKQVYLRGGYYWTVGTRDEWMHDTGLSPHQLRTALKVLQENNVIVLSIGPHPRMHGVLRASHIRLLEDFFIALPNSSRLKKAYGGVDQVNVVKDDGSELPIAPDRSSGNHQVTYIEEKYKGETIGGAQAPSKEIKNSKIGKEIEEDHTSDGDSIITPKDIEAIWKESVEEFFEDEIGSVPFQCGWTEVQLGKAEYLLNNIPNGSIVEIIRTCIRSWELAIDYVESNSLGFNVSKTPDFDTFHRYRQAMVNFHATKNGSKKAHKNDMNWFK